MVKNKIINEGREVHQVIDAALLARAAAGREKVSRVVLHPNLLDVIPGLHRRMDQLLRQLSDTFRKKMELAGIDIAKVQISWRPLGSEQEAYEKLARSRLVLELQQVPIGHAVESSGGSPAIPTAD